MTHKTTQDTKITRQNFPLVLYIKWKWIWHLINIIRVSLTYINYFITTEISCVCYQRHCCCLMVMMMKMMKTITKQVLLLNILFHYYQTKKNNELIYTKVTNLLVFSLKKKNSFLRYIHLLIIMSQFSTPTCHAHHRHTLLFPAQMCCIYRLPFVYVFKSMF